jgi:hypothetical protein
MEGTFREIPEEGNDVASSYTSSSAAAAAAAATTSAMQEVGELSNGKENLNGANRDGGELT